MKKFLIVLTVSALAFGAAFLGSRAALFGSRPSAPSATQSRELAESPSSPDLSARPPAPSRPGRDRRPGSAPFAPLFPRPDEDSLSPEKASPLAEGDQPPVPSPPPEEDEPPVPSPPPEEDEPPIPSPPPEEDEPPIPFPRRPERPIIPPLPPAQPRTDANPSDPENAPDPVPLPETGLTGRYALVAARREGQELSSPGELLVCISERTILCLYRSADRRLEWRCEREYVREGDLLLAKDSALASPWVFRVSQERVVGATLDLGNGEIEVDLMRAKPTSWWRWMADVLAKTPMPLESSDAFPQGLAPVE